MVKEFKCTYISNFWNISKCLLRDNHDYLFLTLDFVSFEFVTEGILKKSFISPNSIIWTYPLSYLYLY